MNKQINFLRKLIKKSPKSGAFTLVELLVVITILGILAAITASVGANYQRQARDAIRKRDLRDVQIALKMYYDNKGHYPRQNIQGVREGFIFGCERPVPLIRPGEVWVCTDDQEDHPVTYMKTYPPDPRPWETPDEWGLESFLNYVYIPTPNFGDTDPDDACFDSLACQSYRLYACLENVNDRSATGPAGGLLVSLRQSHEIQFNCPLDRAPILVSPE